MSKYMFGNCGDESCDVLMELSDEEFAAVFKVMKALNETASRKNEYAPTLSIKKIEIINDKRMVEGENLIHFDSERTDPNNFDGCEPGYFMNYCTNKDDNTDNYYVELSDDGDDSLEFEE